MKDQNNFIEKVKNSIKFNLEFKDKNTVTVVIHENYLNFIRILYSIKILILYTFRTKIISLLKYFSQALI